MEEKVSLALAIKLKKIYEEENQFLTFPLGLAYPYRSLEFMKEGSNLSALERLNYRADFSRMVNQIPADGASVFSPSGMFLWNEMKNVLINAEFATSILSQEEEKQLAEAKDFLTVEGVDITGKKSIIPSEATQIYIDYKIAYEEANDMYMSEKITVENTTGVEAEKLQEVWKEWREKELRDLRDQAMFNWVNFGYKNKVEASQKIRNILEVKKYSVLYRDEYLNDINIAELADTDAQGIPFCVTDFNPRDAFDKDQPWIYVPLLRKEIDSLIQQAPDSLKGVFTADQENDDIQSLSLEYKYIGIKRSWFRPEFFQSRYWKMSDESIVSDGESPAQGRIPAYITGMLAVRNITVTKKKKTGEQKNSVLPILNIATLQNNAVIKAIPEYRLAINPGTMTFMQSVKPPVVDVDNRLKNNADLLQTRTGELEQKPAIRSIEMPNPKLQAVFKPPETAKLISNLHIYKAEELIFTQNIKSMGIGSLIEPIDRIVATPETVTETYDFDGVAILAFVCRRVPLSPNPDPTKFTSPPEPEVVSRRVSLPVLSIGSKGEYVKQLQEALIVAKLYTDVCDGIFGPNTKKAVESFQASNHLTVDGIVGPITWEAVQKLREIKIPD
ncbi:peptidoglycan-binding domain-containing protein [Sporosarcina sp. G11-34]|uniref:peptidoglycan-binding domain-containing protein n=1 Tax=Sporosarcina sp. G11-34 TaxID=2849605 RepID=UPI0022A9061D|nr:peptidoglycan-binding domain-containing protein [Sporosarcina sp. G11-34]MCZ2258593.1 peptidoglycan-binding protein [Sporosarcina sp. G11-34]